ncbi:MAG: WecB/TagA/CpsF family glycosyltransferase [Pseudomonadales bacterium]|nr:WecB/TagA/CpsF family glycosyltransferase [Pseudomonadales bacterium]
MSVQSTNDLVNELASIRLFEVPIASVTMKQAVRLVEDCILHHKRLDIGVVNAAKVVAMQKDLMLRESVLSSDVIFADGQSLVWAARLAGKHLPERVAGIDLMYALLERGSQVGFKVYCLGAEEWVNARVAQKIRDDYPGVQLVGRRNGYFSATEEPEIAKEIADSCADILFVAMTSPLKENFMARWGDAMNTTVTHGVGGSFDVFAGKIRRAPRIMQSLGLEWLFRVMQEPTRLWKRYLTSNFAFLRLLAKPSPPER